MIHVLEHGQPLCQFTTALPRHWPKGHVWTSRAEVKDALAELPKEQAVICTGCAEKVNA